ncbi:MAG TPA: hypothetical protein VHN78_11275 [Chloroflexota bacterium]|nr:hypothetical protein [Chloroflexota bacterium]
MPVASEEQVPKELTYTLMYHFLWCVLFMLSAIALGGVFLAAGQPLGRALGAPLGLVFFALVAGLGTLATYVVRVQILLGELPVEEAFRWSAVSSRAVLIFAPLAWLVWRFVLDPLAQSVPAQITSMVIQVEVIVWWLSHLLSVRGLARGRRKHQLRAKTPHTEATPPPSSTTTQGPPPVAALAGEGSQ